MSDEPVMVPPPMMIGAVLIAVDLFWRYFNA